MRSPDMAGRKYGKNQCKGTGSSTLFLYSDRTAGTEKTVFQPYYNGEDLPVLPEQVRDPVQRKSRRSLCEMPPLRRTGVFPAGGIST